MVCDTNKVCDIDGGGGASGLDRIKTKTGTQKSTRNFKNFRVASLNVGTLKSKSLELVFMMKEKKIDVLCVQETKWKETKAWPLVDGYRLY